ncbi:hypothetical protein BGZ94_007398 [Podila epigama]|nr:hypothetical protein BGZ94_007398 [Podila epigama]
MNRIRYNYVQYGTGNMLNVDAGTIKRKTDSNEFDDEIIQEVQPNGKRACGSNKQNSQFASFHSNSQGTPHTPNGPDSPHNNNSHGANWMQSNPPPLLRSAVGHAAGQSQSGFDNFNYHTPESVSSSTVASPATLHSLDMDMDMNATPANSPMMMQTTNAMFRTTLDSPMIGSQSTQSPSVPSSTGLLPSALPVQPEESQPAVTTTTEYVPVHGRSMEIPSYARVPLNEMRKYRDQRWSSCIYGADARIGQGMMI